MILFSLVDLIFRKFEEEQFIPELNIEASGYSNMITIQVLDSGDKRHDDMMDDCLQTIQQLEAWYNGKVSINLETHSYGCSVIIRNSNHSNVNTIHTESKVVGMT